MYWNRFEVTFSESAASVLSRYVIYRPLCLLSRDCLQVLTRSLYLQLCGACLASTTVKRLDVQERVSSNVRSRPNI